jgi:hypothetical protein
MSDNDLMTDSPELLELRDALSRLAVPERPGLEAITARRRARRRRRVFVAARLSVLGAVAATAIAVTAAGVHGRGSTLVTIRTAAYTLTHNGNGTDTLTLNPVELFDPAQLQNDLAKYGIPAKVTTGSYCTSDPEPAGFPQVVSAPGAGTSTKGSGAQPTITIDPSAMPSGTELSVSNFHLTTGEQQADINLIDTSSYTCTSTPPTLGPNTPGAGFLYGAPGPSES